MKKQLSMTLFTSFLIMASSSVMAKSLVTENPFNMSSTTAADLIMSSDHDHDHDKKSEDKNKTEEKNKDKKSKGKCGEDHMKNNKGKCGGN